MSMLGSAAGTHVKLTAGPLLDKKGHSAVPTPATTLPVETDNILLPSTRSNKLVKIEAELKKLLVQTNDLHLKQKQKMILFNKPHFTGHDIDAFQDGKNEEKNLQKTKAKAMKLFGTMKTKLIEFVTTEVITTTDIIIETPPVEDQGHQSLRRSNTRISSRTDLDKIEKSSRESPKLDKKTASRPASPPTKSNKPSASLPPKINNKWRSVAKEAIIENLNESKSQVNVMLGNTSIKFRPQGRNSIFVNPMQNSELEQKSVIGRKSPKLGSKIIEKSRERVQPKEQTLLKKKKSSSAEPAVNPNISMTNEKIKRGEDCFMVKYFPPEGSKKKKMRITSFCPFKKLNKEEEPSTKTPLRQPTLNRSLANINPNLSGPATPYSKHIDQKRFMPLRIGSIGSESTIKLLAE